MKSVLLLLGVLAPLGLLFVFWQRWRSQDQKRRLLDLALATTFLRLAEDASRTQRDRKYAAAVSNRLFANPPAPSHEALFEQAEIEATAHAILEEDKRVREVVVQSLRLMGRQRSGEQERLAGDVLHRFGDEFPGEPDAKSFENLVVAYAEEINAAAGRIVPVPKPAPLPPRSEPSEERTR